MATMSNQTLVQWQLIQFVCWPRNYKITPVISKPQLNPNFIRWRKSWETPIIIADLKLSHLLCYNMNRNIWMWGFLHCKHLLGLEKEYLPYFTLCTEFERKAAENAPHATMPFSSFLGGMGGRGIFLQTWAATTALLEQSDTGAREKEKIRENIAKHLHTYCKESHGIFCHCTKLLYLLLKNLREKKL